MLGTDTTGWLYAPVKMGSKQFQALSLLSLAALALTVPVAADEPDRTGYVNIFAGRKFLEASNWTPGDQQSELGIESSWGKRSWPALIAVDFFESRDRVAILSVPQPLFQDRLTFATKELGVGARKVWEARSARPYFGGGLTIIQGHQERTIGIPYSPPMRLLVEESHRATGVWFGGGIFWQIREHFDLGVAVRYSYATLPIFEYHYNDASVHLSGNGGGVHTGLILGWKWRFAHAESTAGTPAPSNPVPPPIQQPGSAEPAPPANEAVGSFHLFLGQAMLRTEYWGPGDVQSEKGIEISFGKKSWPILIALELFASARDVTAKNLVPYSNNIIVSAPAQASTQELAAGIRKVWVPGSVRPYVGAGAAQIQATRGYTYTREGYCFNGCTELSATVIGPWAEVGVLWRTGRSFEMGFTGRYSFAKGPSSYSLGGAHVGIVIGAGWPARAPRPGP